MSNVSHYIGQRLSLSSQTCTVRYVGAVKNKTGIWLGVEWDDQRRGKHDGSFEGEQYFTCKIAGSSAGSFLRPHQQWDSPRTFLQALSEKYLRVEDANAADTIFVSRSKQFEEIGFEKFAKRQAELRGIHVVVLDRMQIDGRLTEDAATTITAMCSHITDLDIGGNLFERIEDIHKLCALLPNLRRLTLDGNRFGGIHEDPVRNTFPEVQSLSLNDTLLSGLELSYILTSFPGLLSLDSTHNSLEQWQVPTLPPSITTVDLSDNRITTFDDLIGISHLPSLQTLKLKNNIISKSTNESMISVVSPTLTDLDLGFNEIESWSIIDCLSTAFPKLRSLRSSGNPLYASLKSATNRSLTPEDGYMLTIARLPHVCMLNFSTIREKDRLNAEKYYLSEIAAEAAILGLEHMNSITKRHPRWNDLCEEYGVPEIKRLDNSQINPASLAARLISLELYDSHGATWTMEVPRAYNIYALYGLVARTSGVPFHQLKLIWETGEQDPVSLQDEYLGPTDWDSSDDEPDVPTTTWTMRQVELTPSTRALGTYIEGQRARLRLEL